MKPKFRGGFCIYVNDRSGTMPRKSPVRRKPDYRRDMWTFDTLFGKQVQATSRENAEKLAAELGLGPVL